MLPSSHTKYIWGLWCHQLQNRFVHAWPCQDLQICTACNGRMSFFPMYQQRFQMACRLSPKMSQYIPSLSEDADVRTRSRGKMAEILLLLLPPILEQILRCTFAHTMAAEVIVISKLLHAKVAAMARRGLEHEKTAILHQMSFVSIFLFFVFSPPQSLITGTEMNSAQGCISRLPLTWSEIIQWDLKPEGLPWFYFSFWKGKTRQGTSQSSELEIWIPKEIISVHLHLENRLFSYFFVLMSQTLIA